MKRRGFSLIEMLVVVGIIAILSSLLIVGISKLQTNAKRQQTAQLLENCRAMWAEYDSVNRLHFDQFQLPSPGNVSLESEVAAEQGQNSIGDRIGVDVIITRSIYALMRSQPNIRTAMDKYPSGRMFLTSMATAANGYSYLYNSNQGPWRANTLYGVESLVSYTEPVSGFQAQYFCIHQPTLNPNGTYTPASTPAPPDTGYWLLMAGIADGQVAADTNDPVLLDAWGNPIICVIGSQLGTGVALNANGSIPANQGIVKAGGRSVVVSSPDHRVFWASAGPDGDFSKGDDNLYSFEKF